MHAKSFILRGIMCENGGDLGSIEDGHGKREAQGVDGSHAILTS